METATGVMVLAEIEAGQDQVAYVTEVAWSPVTVDRSADQHRGIWPLAELAEKGSQFEEVKLDEATVQDRWGRVREVMGEEYLLTEPPEPTGQEPAVMPRKP